MGEKSKTRKWKLDSRLRGNDNKGKILAPASRLRRPDLPTGRQASRNDKTKHHMI